MFRCCVAGFVIAMILAGCHVVPGPSSEEALVGPRVRTLTVPGSTQTFDMVWIEAGGFWAGRYEVTWNEYLAYCAWDERLPDGVDAQSRPSEPLPVEPFDRGFGLESRPAIGVSWSGAKSYCEWLSESLGEPIRLPRAAEWDVLAAGAAASMTADVVWHAGNSEGMTHPVGTFPADVNGLHDVFGNLWEYLDEPYSADEDDRPVSCGGSYLTDFAMLEPDLRLPFNWDWLLADSTFPPGRWWIPDGDELGFRIVSTAPGP